jgi:DNA processing protein
LAEQIIEHDGAIISEYPPGTAVSFGNLVERNRLQAGLSDVVILIQSDIKKGGSMHAINTAIENKKPVFAIQYDGNNPMTLGNKKLIEEGKATALTHENKQDIIICIENINESKNDETDE